MTDLISCEPRAGFSLPAKEILFSRDGAQLKHDDVVSDTQGEVVARLVRALLHQMRGDLSVINNDLVYLSSVIDPNEVQRPRERCAQISHLLGRLGVLSQRSPKRSVSAGELRSLFNAQADGLFSCRGLVKIDAELVGRGIGLLAHLLGGVRSTVIASHNDDASLEVCIRGAAPRIVRETYGSASSFALSELGERAVLDGCIVDLIIQDHDWHLRVEQGEEGPMVHLSIRTMS